MSSFKPIRCPHHGCNLLAFANSAGFGDIRPEYVCAAGHVTPAVTNQ